MRNISRFSEEELVELKEMLSEYNSEDLGEEILEEMSGYLIGISIDYGFNDTEVRDWIYLKMKNKGRVV